MKLIDILLVEDNDGDIYLTKEAFQESKIVNEIKVLKDGEAAINFFETLPDGDDHPDLILLDVNLPKVGGHEVLHYIKSSKKYRKIPVIMLTTSSSRKDIISSYDNHVNCYITKPIDVTDFISAVSKIEDFWFSLVTIPPK